jgi:two-component system, response regulator PdtaR
MHVVLIRKIRKSVAKNPELKMVLLKILIVEDEAMTALGLQDQLASFGYDNTIIANNADDALAFFNQNTPGLVLLDINLEGSKMDGIELAEAFNSINRVPIIFTSAYDDAATLQRAKHVKPANYLAKPYTDKQLSIALDMAIDTFSEESMLENDFLFVKESTSYSKKLMSNRVVFHKQNGILELVTPNDIVYCLAYGDMTKVFLKDYKQNEKKEDVPTFTAMRKLGFYDKRLIRDFDFFRVHDGLLLNLNYLKSYSHSTHELRLTNGEKLVAARRKGQGLKDFLTGE